MAKPKITVAIQGERGAFSEEAAGELLGGAITVLPKETFAAMFRSVAEKESRYCLAPIENTLAGSVYENYDLLLQHDLHIVAEINLRIVHNLIAFPGVTLKNLQRVYSHPVALAQCLNFFKRRPGARKIPYYDTAGSVKMLAETRPEGAAAIASRAAAKAYGGRILQTHLEDLRQNFTRFLLLSRSPRKEADGNKISIAFSTRNVAGALFKCLSAFALRDIDLSKIESRPARGRPWEYFFYLDFAGNLADVKVQNALRQLGEVTDFLRVLGCYKSAKRP